jgi:hypothetical protein
VRDRDDRIRRKRDELQRHAVPPAPRSSGPDPWQAIAIVALIAAAAGWTTVALLAFREPATTAVVESTAPSATIDSGLGGSSRPDDEVIPPDVESHEDPALEAILPTEVGGVALLAQSVEGGAILTDDAWSSTVTDFLSSVDRTSADLHLAEASDPNGILDISVDVYRIDGIDGKSLRDVLLAAWSGDNPDLVVTDVTIGGAHVSKLDFGEGVPVSYVLVRDEFVFDVWTDDLDLATEAMAVLHDGSGGSSPAP